MVVTFLSLPLKHHDQGNLWKKVHLNFTLHRARVYDGKLDVEGSRWLEQSWELTPPTSNWRKKAGSKRYESSETTKHPPSYTLPSERPHLVFIFIYLFNILTALVPSPSSPPPFPFNPFLLGFCPERGSPPVLINKAWCTKLP